MRNDGSEASSYAASKTSIFQFPHLLLGVVAIFFDIGVGIYCFRIQSMTMLQY